MGRASNCLLVIAAESSTAVGAPESVCHWKTISLAIILGVLLLTGVCALALHKRVIRLEIASYSYSIRPAIIWEIFLGVALLAGELLHGAPIELAAITAIAIPLLVDAAVEKYQFQKLAQEIRSLFAQTKLYIPSLMGAVSEVAKTLETAYELGPGKMKMSLLFATESLRELKNTGFLRLDVSWHDFLNRITDLSGYTDQTIFGTCVIQRPKKLATEKRDYVRRLLENKNRRLVRITVLHDDEPSKMVLEALASLRVRSGDSPTQTMNDIPEVQWWTEKANGVGYESPMIPQCGEKRMVLWTTHEDAKDKRGENRLVYAGNRVDDYAVFDNSIVVKFRLNREDGNGTLSLLWGNLEVDQYIETLRRVDSVFLDRTRSLDYLGLYPSFFELLKHKVATKGTMSPVDFSDRPDLKKLFDQESNVSLPQVYSAMVKFVNEGAAVFSSDHMNDFTEAVR